MQHKYLRVQVSYDRHIVTAVFVFMPLLALNITWFYSFCSLLFYHLCLLFGVLSLLWANYRLDYLPWKITMCFLFWPQKESEKRNVTVQADDPISFMQLTAKNEMTSKEDQFQLSLLAAMGNTQRKEASDPLASKLNKVRHKPCRNLTREL